MYRKVNFVLKHCVSHMYYNIASIHTTKENDYFSRKEISVS